MTSSHSNSNSNSNGSPSKSTPSSSLPPQHQHHLATLERRGSLTPGVFSEEPPNFGGAATGQDSGASSLSASIDPAATTRPSSNASAAPSAPSAPATSSQQSSVDYFKGAAPTADTAASTDSHGPQPSLSLKQPPTASHASPTQIQRESEKAEKRIISASLSNSIAHSAPKEIRAGPGGAQPPSIGNGDKIVSSPASFAPLNIISMRPDGIGGMGLGTAATGDLGAQAEFETLDDMRKVVKDLEDDFNVKHPEMPLSGRIIHVSHHIPFEIRPLAEVDFERQREERIAATASVAAMAAAARARKAAKLAAQAEQREMEAQRELQRQAGMQETASRKNSFRISSRRSSFATGFGMTGLEGQDFEARLRENQERAKRRAGRRAWMMTEVVDDTSECSEEDRFTPVGSRRGSMWSAASRGSFSSFNQEPWKPVGASYSDANSPFVDSPPTAPLRPQWVLTPRRGHTALNSGIRSLCSTHRQTFIGWPGDVRFAVQARDDQRSDPSETTDGEKREIEDVLASLDSASAWVTQQAPVAGAPVDPESNQPPVGKVPVPVMNGAEPIGSTRSSARPNGTTDRQAYVTAAATTARSAATKQTGEQEHGIKYVPVWLDYNVAHGHYEGYCKATLWPLFHYLLWQDVNSERRAWEEYSWDAYYAANEAFAKRIAQEYKPGDMVWIHDYHLLLVPLMLRKLVPDAIIGLFVHAPFPSSEVFRCLPKRKEILEGMLGADLACFQAFSYSRHFLSSCIRVCGYEASSNAVESANGHVTNITYNPIGIDSVKIAKDSSTEGVLPKIEAIREMYKGKKILVGRDKLDVVRGVVQKLQAFHKFLAEYPEWRNRVVLIQVTAPALNDSPKLERQVSELVSHINGEFGSLSFTPVHHYHQIIDRDEYFALLSVADLALITSVRDGMNTTSMEYIICQNKFNKSPLILSEFTGTAGRMRSAIQVNPWNIFGVAKAIDYALRLSDEEKRARHDQLYHQVVMHTSHTWAAGLVKQLLQRLHGEHSAHLTPPLDRKEMVGKYREAKKRLLLLDYDGTLTPIVKVPEMALPSERLLKALEVLSKDPQNVIYIISGRDATFLGKHLGQFNGIGFSAEHGGFVKSPGSSTYHNLTETLDMTWMKDIRSVFEYYTERTTGSFIEQKKSAITWHYRGADPDFGSFQAKECQAHLENLTSQNKLAIEVLVGKKNLEVRPLAINKGEIVKRILWEHSDAEFVFCAGDDKTDEDMFRSLFNLNPSSSEIDAHHDTDGAENTALKPYLAELSKDHALLISPPTPLKGGTPVGSPKKLSLNRGGIYTTMIGPNNRKTLAEWHVDSCERIIDSLAEMAGLSDPDQDAPSEQPKETDGGKETEDKDGRERVTRASNESE
ncbi:related to trehalose-6-phosphate phosphatase [Melanopsichium pennsylvanicum]|uniref:Related to trehalose-6-phosphate phosphatase n=2 Tax=Melanopsichium pennsylvanicum TaxID=63383 RepID=A0AAJ4XML1_9BASI|nr:related to trehalose-6-phosphate phosphatase [Melanopsichium pennsylvanicum 4]SNX85000.1 related to trehalose-6-phosphate phosphatase [Melanopsichium pennsylvanicum]